MTTAKALWVDDAFHPHTPTLLATGIENLRVMLINRLHTAHDVDLQITKVPKPLEALGKLMQERFDLVILDLVLDETNPAENGLALLTHMRDRRATPTAIVCNEANVTLLERQLREVKGMYFGLFPKNIDVIDELARQIANAVTMPPLCAVVFSDLHTGHPEQDSLFVDALLRKEFPFIKKHFQPDLLVATGDFAWKSQSAELPSASQFLNTARHALGVHGPNQFQFCPGNHDISLHGEHPWEAYSDFVRSLTGLEPGITERFQSSRFGAFYPFREQADLLAVSKLEKQSVLVAALNSVAFTHNPGGARETYGSIGEKQWLCLERRPEHKETLRDGFVKLALTHHPMLAAPSFTTQTGKGDVPIEDQPHALMNLPRLGYQILIHGHTHLACVYECRFNLLGAAAGVNATSGKLLIVATPTLGAVPNAAAPFRQHLILQLSHYDANARTRTVTVIPRVYQPGPREWNSGSMFKTEITC